MKCRQLPGPKMHIPESTAARLGIFNAHGACFGCIRLAGWAKMATFALMF